MRFLTVIIDLKRNQYTVENVPSLADRLIVLFKLLLVVWLSLSFAFALPPFIPLTKGGTSVCETVSKTVCETVFEVGRTFFLPRGVAWA